MGRRRGYELGFMGVAQRGGICHRRAQAFKLGRVLLAQRREVPFPGRGRVGGFARVRLAQLPQLRRRRRRRRALGLGFGIERHERAGRLRARGLEFLRRVFARGLERLRLGPPELRGRGLVLLRERRALGRGLALGRLDLSRPRGAEGGDLRVALAQLVREAVPIGSQRVEVRRMPRDISFQGCYGRVVALLGDGVLVFDGSELVPCTQRRALGLFSRLGDETKPQRRQRRRQVGRVRVINRVEVRRRRRGRRPHGVLHGP
mmetsp:Transcript_18498/g.48255  ORF Transcript_18498/g.48255 Transcript_18498/m.48255 type:complete len:261 (+) Transcript_18498:1303-2085(+)